MIVYDESEYLETDVSNLTLQFVQEMYGPVVKDWLLLPGPVPIAEAEYDYRVAIRA